jgi:lipoprotein-anchoring transpeptidase ErfK/SrfK
MNSGYDQDVWDPDVWELMGRIISYLFRIVTAAAFVLLIATSPAPAHSPGQVALDDTPITAGDAEKAGTLPPPPPYDPAAALLPGPVKPTDEPNYSPTPTRTPSATPTPSRVHIDGVITDQVPTPGQLAYKATRDITYLDPLSWSVTILKKRHQLIVYYKGRLFKTYHAVFGRSFEPGTKLWEGDRRTPEGVYAIIGKHPSRRWEWFLTLNYPNDLDRRRYEQLRDGGVVPVEEGRPVGVGGRIGIHGSDEPVLNRGDVNWTTGCISVNDQDIDELYKLLPTGTVVIIKP